MSEQSIEILRELVAFNTVSSNSNLQMIDYLEHRLKKAGFDTHRAFHPEHKDHKTNLIAALFPPLWTAPHKGGLMLSGHTDVVPVDGQDWGDHDPFKMRMEDGKLIGRGTADMKGFIAGIMAQLDQVATGKLTRPFFLNLTYDEEVGCTGVDAAIKEFLNLGIDPDAGFVGEPTLFNVVYGHKANSKVQVRFKGTAGHSSDVDEPDVLGVDEMVRRFQTRLKEIQYADIQRDLGDNHVGKATVAITGQTGMEITRNIAPEGEVITYFDCRTGIDVDEPTIRKVFNDVASKVFDDFSRRGKTAHMEIEIISISLGNRGFFCTDVVAIDYASRMAQTSPDQMVSRVIASFGAETANYSRAREQMPHGHDKWVVCGPGSIKQAHKAKEFIEIAQMDRMDRFTRNVINECHL